MWARSLYLDNLRPVRTTTLTVEGGWIYTHDGRRLTVPEEDNFAFLFTANGGTVIYDANEAVPWTSVASANSLDWAGNDNLFNTGIYALLGAGTLLIRQGTEITASTSTADRMVEATVAAVPASTMATPVAAMGEIGFTARTAVTDIDVAIAVDNGRGGSGVADSNAVAVATANGVTTVTVNVNANGATLDQIRDAIEADTGTNGANALIAVTVASTAETETIIANVRFELERFVTTAPADG